MHVPGELWEYCFVSSPPDLRSHFSVLYLRRYLFVRSVGVMHVRAGGGC